jgi:hypothetical protein
VAFEAVLEDHLGGVTELVLGVSALNAARQKAGGSEEATIDLNSGWYTRIGKHPWLLQAISTADDLVTTDVKVGAQQNTLISATIYQTLLGAGRAGALRLAEQADHESARVDASQNGHQCSGGIPFPQTTIVLTSNRVAVALVASVLPSGDRNIMLGRRAMGAIELDVTPAPITEATRPSKDVENLQQMKAVLLAYCARENPALPAYPQRMALVHTEMQRRRKNKADTRNFLTWLRTVSMASCARPYCPNLTVSVYCCRTCAHQHRDVIYGVIRGGRCENPRCRGLKRGKLLKSELKEGQIPEFFDFCGLSCRNAFRTQRDQEHSS